MPSVPGDDDARAVIAVRERVGARLVREYGRDRRVDLVLAARSVLREPVAAAARLARLRVENVPRERHVARVVESLRRYVRAEPLDGAHHPRPARLIPLDYAVAVLARPVVDLRPPERRVEIAADDAEPFHCLREYGVDLVRRRLPGRRVGRRLPT